MKLSFRTALVWSALSGCIALSWEIVWSRLYNFVSGSQAASFGYMLGSYLFGIAAGSLWSRRWQRPQSQDASPWRALGSLTLIANLCAFLLAPVLAWIACHRNWMFSYVWVALAGSLLGVLFPLLCHAAIPADERVGGRLSRVYLANIIGSGFGSLFTGFALMEWMGLQGICVLLLVMSYLWAEWMARGRLNWIARLGVLITLLLTAQLFDQLYERLQYKFSYREKGPFTRVLESRHGVITVNQDGAVFGNGAFDGILDLDLDAHRTPTNWNVRPYFVAALVPKIEDVLVIGVASGGWTQILANNPSIKHITAVEISHSYLDLISSTPLVAPLLTDPRVEIVIDDGRRWMKANPGRKFDAIFCNTIIHWREFSSSLLSVEFLELVKHHLRPEGITIWNTTGSIRAAATGMKVFPHTGMLMNFAIGSLVPIQPDRERWRQALTQWRLQDRPLFDLSNPADQQRLNDVLGFIDHKGLPADPHWWQWCDREMMRPWSKAPIITDDNLGHEYRR